MTLPSSPPADAFTAREEAVFRELASMWFEHPRPIGLLLDEIQPSLALANKGFLKYYRDEHVELTPLGIAIAKLLNV